MKVNHIHFETIDSTNKYLKENNERYDSFTFVSSDYQTHGKGRNDRVWTAEQEKNVLMSFIVKDEELLNEFSSISIGTAYVIAEYLESLGIKGVSIKWPNDIYINGKKVCGILLEASLPNYLVVGFGLNLNQKQFLGDYRVKPTSVANELGGELDKDIVIDELIKRLTAFIANMSGNREKLKQFITSHNYLLNKHVKVNNIEGIVVGIDENNCVLLQTNEGIEQINSGEIDISLQYK